MASRWLASTLTLLVTSACCHRPEGEPPAAGPGRQNAASTQPTVAAAVPQPMQTAPRVGNPFEGVVFFRNPEYTRPCPTCPSISTRRMQVGSGGRAIPRSWRQSSRMCWSERQGQDNGSSHERFELQCGIGRGSKEARTCQPLPRRAELRSAAVGRPGLGGHARHGIHHRHVPKRTSGADPTAPPIQRLCGSARTVNPKTPCLELLKRGSGFRRTSLRWRRTPYPRCDTPHKAVPRLSASAGARSQRRRGPE